MNNYSIRYATSKDIDFLVQTIIEAEKSGTKTLSYTTIFGLTEEQTFDCLYKILEEELDGCELSLSSFLIAEQNGQIAAAVGAWIEAKDGVDSTAIKGSLLAYTLPLEAIKKASLIAPLVSQLHIEVEKGVLQIGLVYVSPDHRGKKLVKLLIDEHIKESIAQDASIKEVHVQVFGNNIPAIRAYENCGFVKSKEIECIQESILNYLPDQKKIVMKYII